MKRTVVAAAFAALVAGFATSQPVTGEIVLANNGGFHGNSIIAMGRFGIITTVLPLPAGQVGGVTMNQVGNEVLVNVGASVRGVNNGAVRQIIGNVGAPLATDMIVDEDNTYVFAAGSSVLGINPISSARTTLATGFGNAIQVMWYGTDGSIYAIDASDDTIHRIERDGTRTIVATVPGARCMEWDRYTGDIFVAAVGTLYKMTAGGQLTTLSQATSGLDSPSGMFLRSDRLLLVTQDSTGSNPTGLYAYYGANGVFNRPFHEDASPATGINPTDITVDHFRELAPVGTDVRVGGTHQFNVNFSLFPGKTFVGALSFSHAPGIPVGNFRLHLNYDVLMALSLTTPALFQNFGTLSIHGTGRMTLNVPNIAGIAGLRLFMGALVIDPSRTGGIGEVSNCLGFTIKPKV